jgi:hypothetical protein
MPEDHRWEVSDLLYWSKAPWNEEVLVKTGVSHCQHYQERMSGPKSNWSIGELVQVGIDREVRWEVTLAKGPNVEVSVLDQFNEPLRNRSFSVFLDLEALSHTGRGGEIPIFDVRTDDKGQFSLSNIGMFFYSFDLGYTDRYCAPNASVWTSVVSARFEENQGKLVYHRCVGSRATFVVTDEQTGCPIASASILQMRQFPNSRGGITIGHTDTNGVYTTEAFYTEHVVSFGAIAEGYEPYFLGIEAFVSDKTYEIPLVRERPNVQITLYSDKSDYAKGEPIKLKYEVLWLGDTDAKVYLNTLTFPELEVFYHGERLVLHNATPVVVRSTPGRHEIRTLAPTMTASSYDFIVNSPAEPIRFLSGTEGYYIFDKRGSYVIRAKFDYASPWKLVDEQQEHMTSNAIVIRING